MKALFPENRQTFSLFPKQISCFDTLGPMFRVLKGAYGPLSCNVKNGDKILVAEFPKWENGKIKISSGICK
jgi:hypothetical protein